MDPDRGITSLFASPAFAPLLFLFSFALFLVCVKMLASLDRDETGEELLGVSDLFAGLWTLTALLGAAALWAGLRWFAPLVLWARLLVLIIALFAIVPALAAGRLRVGRAPSALLAVPARLLGRIVCFLPLLYFRLRSLSAASPVTEEEILDLVDDAEEGSFIDETQKEMISAVFELDDLEAGEIMTHRTEMEAVEETTPARQIIATALEKGFSRFPVYRKNLDDVVGILHIKDLLVLVEHPGEEDEPVSRYMRSAMFVPESCHARELLLEFKQKHTQIAVVVDEYGGTAGIITMEDILEEIVGSIQDEFDNEEEELTAVDGGFETDGSTDLDDIFEEFDLDPPEREEYEDFDSVGGMILQRLGRFPAPNEEIVVTYGGVEFTVLSSGERRIERVLCRLPVAVS